MDVFKHIWTNDLTLQNYIYHHILFYYLDVTHNDKYCNMIYITVKSSYNGKHLSVSTGIKQLINYKNKNVTLAKENLMINQLFL